MVRPVRHYRSKRASVGLVSDPLGEKIGARTLELIDIASPSRGEQALANHVKTVLSAGGLEPTDLGDDCLIAGTKRRGERPLVLLAGHFDTVPAQGNIPGSIDAERVHGLGAADMKGSLAVMIELALAGVGIEQSSSQLDLGFLFFSREELPASESSLTPLLAAHPELQAAELVLMMEPTANVVQAGCLGNCGATWTFSGRSGHSARPWLAENAIERLAEGVAAIAAIDPIDHNFGGLSFKEVVSVTSVAGGIARNVIPGEATAYVNYRFPPGMSLADAEARIRTICEPFGSIEIEGSSPSGAVRIDDPLTARLVKITGQPIEPKQAWTPVAEFEAAGIAAVNFGPGEPAAAHAVDEAVTLDALAVSYRSLEQLVCGAP
jgi:succinyl-diaminopimelate desuccinylase